MRQLLSVDRNSPFVQLGEQQASNLSKSEASSVSAYSGMEQKQADSGHFDSAIDFAGPGGTMVAWPAPRSSLPNKYYSAVG